MTNLKVASCEYRPQWHKHLPLTVLTTYTTYHTSLGCKPSRIVHGRVPNNVLNHQLGLNSKSRIVPKTDFADEFQRRKILAETTKAIIVPSYVNYKEYCDRKTKATPLHLHYYCFSLQPIADTQDPKFYSVNSRGSDSVSLKKFFAEGQICSTKT